VLGDIPILGNLFKSKSFQKQETELMFIVTAQLVKPVNRDDLPQMRGIDGLKKGSPLGVEPKGEGIEGQSGFSIGSGAKQTEPSATPQPVAPAPKTATPAVSTSTGSAVSSTRPTVHVAPPPALDVPAALAMRTGQTP
jgi:pilus assembly protein CpaC